MNSEDILITFLHHFFFSLFLHRRSLLVSRPCRYTCFIPAHLTSSYPTLPCPVLPPPGMTQSMHERDLLSNYESSEKKRQQVCQSVKRIDMQDTWKTDGRAGGMLSAQGCTGGLMRSILIAWTKITTWWITVKITTFKIIRLPPSERR